MKLTEMKLTVRTLITVLSIVLVTSLLTAAVCKLGDKSVEALETEISELKNTNQSLVDENQSLKNNVASFEEKNKRFNALFDKLYAELKECKAINK